MGYGMDQIDNRFRIAGAGKAAATRALIEAQIAAFGPAATLESVLQDDGWDLDVNPETGDITGVFFCGQKYYDQEKTLAIIAPFVADGSYIDLIGEDFERWRWVFRGGVLYEHSGRWIPCEPGEAVVAPSGERSVS